MAVVSVGHESKSRRAVDGTSFYVPYFEVKIEGAGLPRDVLRDVVQLTYKDDIKTLDSFELTVNNWDPATNDFRYVGSETAQTLEGDTPESRRYRLFDPCNKNVEVWMGYVGQLLLMLKGNFTTMEPTFPGSGAPTLTVRGLNVLHQLRRKQYTTSWKGKKDSEVAKNIATLRDQGKKRFPLPITTDPTAVNDEKSIPIISQKNQYDIDFLWARARQRGYVVYVQEENKERRTQQQLYFGPSDAGANQERRDVTFKLEWGASLVDFKPTLTTANQVRSVTVNGWNRNTRKPINATVNLDDRKLRRNKDLYELLQKCDPREEVVVDEPVFTPQQARQRAIAILLDRQKEMVKASATTVGLPELRAGRTVQIAGLGSRFSGTYFVTDTTHTIGDGGYTTRFNARREDGGTSS